MDACIHSAFAVWKIGAPPNPLGRLRAIHVPPTIIDMFEGRRIDTGFPDYRANSFAAIFGAGQYVRVSLIGDPEKKRPDLERLTDMDEAWAMCFRSPKPGWRLLGRFVAKNVFVSACLLDRLTLDGDATYARYAQAMITRWGEGLPEWEPIRGLAWQDYLDGTVKDVYGDTDLPA